MSDHVRLEIRDGVARFVLDRPAERNALTREMLVAIREAALSVSTNKSVRALQLRASGADFCTGMNLDELLAHARSAGDETKADSQALRDAVWSLFRVPVPTVAVVQGAASASGMGLVLACDLVLAADTATFSLPDPSWGTAAAMVTPLLVYRVGTSAASRMLLSLTDASAEEALRLGLCHGVAAPAELDTRADEWTSSILRGSRSALATTKQFLMHCGAESIRAHLDAATTVSASARASQDAIEGLAAAVEGRSPSWAN